MKKSLLFIIAIVAVLSSCKNEYETNLSKMSNSMRQSMDNMAFKDDCFIEYLIFEPISYDTVSIDEYYALLLNTYDLERDRHFDLANQHKLKFERELNSAKLSRIMKDFREADESIKEAEKWQEMLDYEKDVILSISSKIDSIILLSEKDDESVWFKMKTYIKASIIDSNNKSSSNVLDTMYALFDYNLTLSL